MLGNASIKSPKFRTNWVEMNDDSSGTYNSNSQIKYKASMLKSSLCDYSDAYILVNETITIKRLGGDNDAKTSRRNKLRSNV